MRSIKALWMTALLLGPASVYAKSYHCAFSSQNLEAQQYQADAQYDVDLVHGDLVDVGSVDVDESFFFMIVESQSTRTVTISVTDKQTDKEISALMPLQNLSQMQTSFDYNHALHGYLGDREIALRCVPQRTGNTDN